jgi:hypothetical protein
LSRRSGSKGFGKTILLFFSPLSDRIHKSRLFHFDSQCRSHAPRTMAPVDSAVLGFRAWSSVQKVRRRRRPKGSSRSVTRAISFSRGRKCHRKAFRGRKGERGKEALTSAYENEKVAQKDRFKLESSRIEACSSCTPSNRSHTSDEWPLNFGFQLHQRRMHKLSTLQLFDVSLPLFVT